MKSFSRNFRRAKPLLGTIVEVSLFNIHDDRAMALCTEAFERISQIQKLLNFHDPSSEVSMINCAAPGKELEISAHTYSVLEFALRLCEQTNGAFNPFLPSSHQAEKALMNSTSDGMLQLHSSNQITLKERVRLDLGGIAKGYAVDYACATFDTFPEISGIINAGGDLRVFGQERREIHIRDPQLPQRLAHSLLLINEALATSANYPLAESTSSYATDRLHNGQTGDAIEPGSSVSVIAKTCMLADALTKAGHVLCEDEMEFLLEKYQATMIRLEAQKDELLDVA